MPAALRTSAASPVNGKNLRAIDGSTQALGAGAAGAAQIQFSPDGRVLAVTEKGSSTIDTFALDAAGRAGPATTSGSVGATPFGFDFDQRGDLLASNASGSASSYSIDANGQLQVISGAVAANQTAPCRLVVGKSGRYAYTANGGSGTISRFGIGSDGSLTLLDLPGSPAASLGAGSHPLDLAISSDGRFLHNLNDGLHRISGWQIAAYGPQSGSSPPRIRSGAPRPSARATSNVLPGPMYSTCVESGDQTRIW